MMAARRGRQITNFGGFFDPFSIGGSLGVGYREVIEYTVYLHRLFQFVVDMETGIIETVGLNRSARLEAEIETGLTTNVQIARSVRRRVELEE